MTIEYRVSVYENLEKKEVISRVRYNASLDYWNGKENSNGGKGYHKGITKLKDGRYVIIYGSDWQGDKDYGIVVSAEEALEEILKSGNNALLKTKKYKELNELYKSTISNKGLIEEEA
ncbi:hypothetical protein ACW5UC_24985 [Priestia aryabhattai]|uniref:hypothetical protein n=1 Tax=Priestia megaterium TaxID=1404 RepID=UPI003F95D44A